MKPGERVRLITESTGSLEMRSWVDAQLVLDQFGFEVLDLGREPEVDRRAYFHDRIKAAQDDVIRELHTFLIGEDSQPVAGLGAPWGDLPIKLFVSHRHDQRRLVGDLKGWLLSLGIGAFVAHEDIEPSVQWRETIREALRSCDALLAVVDSKFHSSEWCDQEVGWALGRSIPIMSLRIEEGDRRDGFLGEHQDLRASSVLDAAFEVLKVLLRDPRTNQRARPALVESLVSSGSYDQTRKLMTLIMAEEKFTNAEASRLLFAVETNRQVYEAVFLWNGESQSVPEVIVDIAENFL